MRTQRRTSLTLIPRGLWDRLTASDPGLTRLHLAGSAAIGVASTLVVEYGFARILHAGPKGTIVSMLFGAVLAMIGMMALSGNDSLWTKVRTAAFFPVAIGIGLAAGTAVNRHTDVMLGVFVLVMFAAVAVRRFGIAFFFYGFMGWIGYFFASFMKASVSSLPGLFSALIVAAIWVLFLSSTVLRANPSRALTRTRKAFDSRARAVARACADLLNSDSGERNKLLNRLRARQIQLSEAALMIEGWSAEPGGLPKDYSAPRLRRRVVDAQQVLDTLAVSAEALVDSQAEVRQTALQTAEYLAGRNDAAAVEKAHELEQLVIGADFEKSQQYAAAGFVQATLELAEIGLETAYSNPGQNQDQEQDNPKATVDEFEPVVGLFMGNLPGSPAIAQDVPAVGVRWNPLARLDLTTRQAIQVAVAGGLAILAGRALSPVRYYWAVIAAFIMFTGTATRTESFLKGLNRVIGTLIGLFASIWIAELTAGHTLLVLLVVVGSIFFGFYLIRVSYAYMIFFITIMIGQLYSILHEFSTGLLLLRLEETTIGAVMGFIVAVLVVPLSTRDTVRAARNNFLNDLGKFLETVAKKLEGDSTSDITDLDAPSLVLDNRLRQLALVAKPLTRPLIWGYSPRVRHRLVLYAALTTGARAVAVRLRDQPLQPDANLASSFRELAQSAWKYAESAGRTEPSSTIDPGKAPGRRPTVPDTESIWGICVQSKVNAMSSDPLIRRLLHLRRLLYDLETENADPL